MEYLCHMTTDYCSLCRNHNIDLSSFMSYHRMKKVIRSRKPGQSMSWPKENRQEDKQWSTNHYTGNWSLSNRKHKKTEDNNLNRKNHVIETSSVQHSAFKQCIRMNKLRELSRLVNTYMLHGKSWLWSIWLWCPWTDLYNNWLCCRWFR
jgi:hypothetical protein